MNEPWYKNAIIYGVDVRTFCDANGDGVGDFEGLTSRLDHLAELGVTCLWVLPFFPTPDGDNGYDITDYFSVDPRCGTLDDVIRFIREAGARSMRVVFDLVMNHTSSAHPWFQAARRAPSSRYRDFYVWTETPPPMPEGQGPMFPGQEQHVWTFDEVAGAYYHHRFYHHEPTLNAANPKVIAEMERVLEFWLCFGISGYRVDAAPHLICGKGLPHTEHDDPHALLRELRRAIDDNSIDGCLIAEADVPPSEMADYFGDGDEMNTLFNFYLNNMLFLALARESAEPIERALRALPSVPESCQWCNFVRNLDELDLEQLSEDERAEVHAAFAPDPDMRIFDGRGIRRRAAPMLGSARAQLAFSLTFSMPGSPMLVYGDEIGMGEELDLEGRDAVRPPMAWSDAPNGGFSSAKRERLYRPVVADGPYAFKRVNVAAQRGEPDSPLTWMQQLIAQRRRTPEIGAGNAQILETGDDVILGHRAEYRGRSAVFLHNFSGRAHRARINAGDVAGKPLERTFGNAKVDRTDSEWRIELEPYGFCWFRAD